MSITGIGPSLVDITCRLPEKQFQLCTDLLEIEPGEWKRINSKNDFAKLSELVTQSDMNVLEYAESNISKNITLTAGCTVLGMLGAMKPKARYKSSMATTVAIDERGVISPLSLFFSDQLSTIGTKHIMQEVAGENPVGFVICSEYNPEKLLVNYPGVGTDLEFFAPENIGDYILIDAYEMLEGKISELIDELILSTDYKICLSLGNSRILSGVLKDKIRLYIENGKIFMIAGNEDEYQTLYPTQSDACTKTNFLEHTVTQDVPNCLITFGEKGLAASWDGRPQSIDAFPIQPEKIINTSGAGDTAMGAFIAGIVLRDQEKETLARAAYWATEVLKRSGSMVIAND